MTAFRAPQLTAWWQNAAIYEVYVRSFQDSNGDGVGDLPGLISRLDYLAGTDRSLGVDGIWLAPIYPSPLFDFGYDVTDHAAIDPLYGMLDDFIRLTEGAHDRGLKVIMDLILNHTSHLHPWFLASRSSRTDPHRAWYVWRDPGPDGGVPNNWQSVFGGPAWTLDEGTGQYYLHSFLPEQPDLNWWHPEVRKAMLDVVRSWTARGVDGFRLDAVSHVGKHPECLDDPEEGPLCNSRNYPVLYEWLEQVRRVADEDGTPRMLVSEAYDLSDDEVHQYHGTTERPRVHIAFNFAPIKTPWNGGAMRCALEGFIQSLPPGVWPNTVLNNHDVPRSATRYAHGPATVPRERVAAMMLLTMPGTAFLYYGEEIGMENVPVPRELRKDPGGGPDWNGGRDPARTPMQWDGTPLAGFTTGTPWLPVGPNHTCVNVAVEEADPSSLLCLYRDLIRLRKGCPALAAGSYCPLETTDNLFCYLREVEDQRVLVALNFSSEDTSIDLGHLAGSARVLISTSGPSDTRDLSPLRMERNEGLVLLLD